MTITINPDELLEVLGTEGEHWTKGTYSSDDNVCLHGAIRRCQPHPGDAYIIEQVAIRKGWGPSWNDDHDTKWADVKALILAGVEITDADLADTYGPQWEAIVALVRRAAVLTADEGRDLAAAWVAAGDAAREAAREAARDAAWAAAWDAARVAAGNAAWVAAGNAAWDAARFAAWDAARALVVRDLIGQHGFTQEHYDTLTGPWRKVIGPVHPDDAVLS